jgi:hypothetical protein
MLERRLALLGNVAARHAGSLAAELVPAGRGIDLPTALAAHPSRAGRERLWIRSSTAKEAAD